MNHLLPCPSCQRHVRSRETACPFCGVALAFQDWPAPPLPLPQARLGRASLFAFGASLAGAVAANCAGELQPSEMPVYGAPPAAVSGTSGGSTSTNAGGSSGTGGASGASGSGEAGGTSIDSGADASDNGADAADAPDNGGPVPIYGSPPP